MHVSVLAAGRWSPIWGDDDGGCRCVGFTDMEKVRGGMDLRACRLVHVVDLTACREKRNVELVDLPDTYLPFNLPTYLLTYLPTYLSIQVPVSHVQSRPNSPSSPSSPIINIVGSIHTYTASPAQPVLPSETLQQPTHT